MQYKHIAVEGNIGSGKTTLAKMLANDFEARLMLEQFANNPFLPKFYNDPAKHAFPLELFFMAERYYQLKNLKLQDLFQPNIISDYFFVKSKLFAQNNLQKDEMQLFNKLFDIMKSSLSKPNLLVYLHAEINRLQQNIKQRGRDFEQNISDEYLRNIQDKYLDYLRKQNDFPVLILNITAADFVADKLVYESIKKHLSEIYYKGVHQVDLCQ
ncbi:MAG: deoxynucleoside kinase [Flavobacteriales bacterium]|nr:deoxynucleoside kinase [Flavobacteriales bacterium]